MRSSEAGGALGFETFGSGGVAGSLTTSFWGGGEADGSLSAAAPPSDDDGV